MFATLPAPSLCLEKLRHLNKHIVIGLKIKSVHKNLFFFFFRFRGNVAFLPLCGAIKPLMHTQTWAVPLSGRQAEIHATTLLVLKPPQSVHSTASFFLRKARSIFKGDDCSGNIPPKVGSSLRWCLQI